MTVLDYLAKLKKESRASFWCTFSAWFFYQTVPYLILKRQSFNVTLFDYGWALRFMSISLVDFCLFMKWLFSQDIKQNVLLSFYLDRWHHFSRKQPKQWLTRRKTREDENILIWISRERKELFRWNKKHCSQFPKNYHLVKNKNFIKNSGQKL